LADEVRVDALGSLIVLKKGTGGGKRVMLSAHMTRLASSSVMSMKRASCALSRSAV